MTQIQNIETALEKADYRTVNVHDEAYNNLLRLVLDAGYEKGDRTKTGTQSVFGAQARFDLRKGFPLLTTKKMFWRGIVAELLWFLAGDTNVRTLSLQGITKLWHDNAYDHYCKVLSPAKGLEPLSRQIWEKHLLEYPEFAAWAGDLGDVYGAQWRRWKQRDGTERDQLLEIINRIKTKPDDRRLLVTAWNPEDVPNMALPPCHCLYQFYTHELSVRERLRLCSLEQIEHLDPMKAEAQLAEWGIPTRQLDCQLYQRSCDLFLGEIYAEAKAA